MVEVTNDLYLLCAHCHYCDQKSYRKGDSRIIFCKHRPRPFTDVRENCKYFLDYHQEKMLPLTGDPIR